MLARLTLAVVFAFAGLAKLVDRTGTQRMLGAFGVPAVLVRPVGTALPVVELGVAGALLFGALARAAAVVAIGMLLIFLFAISVNVAHGRRPECRCFGQLHASPLSRWTLVRNGALMAMATVVALQGPGPPTRRLVGWTADLDAPAAAAVVAGGALAALGTLNAWLLVTALRQNGRMLLRLEELEASLWRGAVLATPPGTVALATGLPVGAAAPDFRLQAVSGGATSLKNLLSFGKPVILLFSEPDCDVCNELLPEVRRWQRDHGGKLTIAVISYEKNSRPRRQQPLSELLLQCNGQVAKAYRVELAPSAIVVSPDGTVASSLSSGAEAIRRLVERTIDGSLLALRMEGHSHGPGLHLPEAPKVGEPAPPLRLPGLGGTMLNLQDFQGRSIFLLFWAPDCPLCGNVLSELKAWEARAGDDAPALFLVITGTVDASQVTGLRTPIVFDHGFAAARLFGIFGTPSALLVGPDGRIASELIVGTAQVLAFLRAN
jgi:peroxiredoxin/uncharacterized membrane protein YphA (DoxX/SURF4 family)